MKYELASGEDFNHSLLRKKDIAFVQYFSRMRLHQRE